MEDYNLNKKNIFIWVLLPLLLSAIWEKLLSPLFDKCIDYILSFSNVITNTISNYIYMEISNGITDYYSALSSGMISGVLGGILLYSFFRFLKPRHPFFHFLQKSNASQMTPALEEKRAITKNKPKRLFYFTVVYFFFSFMFFFLVLLETSYVQTESIRLTNNIEIVSPYVSDLEYKQLKSAFHSMNSRSDYDELISKLEILGTQHNLKLK